MVLLGAVVIYLTAVLNLLGMVLKINKADYERLIVALESASESESNANKKRLLNLTRKKIVRQNEILCKKDKKRIRGI